MGVRFDFKWSANVGCTIGRVEVRRRKAEGQAYGSYLKADQTRGSLAFPKQTRRRAPWSQRKDSLHKNQRKSPRTRKRRRQSSRPSCDRSRLLFG